MLWGRRPSWDLNPGTCAPRAQGSTQGQVAAPGLSPRSHQLPILAQPQRLRVQGISS